MKLTGRYELGASDEIAFQLLLDSSALKACLPGCQRLEEVAPDRFEAVMKLGIPGLKGTFTGKVWITDKVPPRTLTLAVEARGPMGFVKAEARIALRSVGTMQCEVEWSGDVYVTGPIAAVGERIISGAATMMTKQFFDAMQQRLAPPHPGSAP